MENTSDFNQVKKLNTTSTFFENSKYFQKRLFDIINYYQYVNKLRKKTK